MKPTRKYVWIALLMAALLALASLLHAAEAASKYDEQLKRWSRSQESKDDMGGRFILKATLYTAEYINTLMESEAEKNLWTASELEDYKYNFLKSLNLEERIAIHLEMENLGASAHMAPFNEMVYMWIGKNKYAPVDYEQRFNMPLQGKRDGMVYFPRFDEKTGASLLKKDTQIRLVLNGAASPVLMNREIRFTWDVKAESSMMVGTAADRMEVDRLIRRVEKLSAERTELESQLEAKNREIKEVTDRIDELQKK